MSKRGRKPYPKQLVKDVRWYYYNTSCSISRIARHFDISFTTVSNMIGKKGAYVERYKPSLRINLMGHKTWVILDGRAWDDPDRACVYCAYDDRDSSLEMVFKDRDNDWTDGVIFEYDQLVKKENGKFITYIVNQKLIG